MDILFYNLSKRENSTLRPTGAGDSRSVFLKEGTSIYNPTFIMADDVTEYNYCQWGVRYYYIRDIVLAKNQRFEVECALDSLATFKDEIGEVSAFSLYATSGFNDGIPDDRLSTVDTASIQSSNLGLFDSGAGDGTYILQYATSASTKGPCGILWLSDSDAKVVSAALNETGFNDFLDNFAKQLVGAYDALISCRYVPLNWYSLGTSGGSKSVVLAGYATSAAGKVPSDVVTYEGTISIPWQFSDFRNLSPYTSLLLYLPGYGFLEINPADVIGKTSLAIRATCDGITGDVFYIVVNIARCSTNISSPIAIGTTGTNSFGVAGGLVSAGANLLGGNYMGATADLFGAALASVQRTVGVCGSNGGLAGVFANVGTSGMTVRLYSICHNTSDNPADMAASHGRPVRAVQGVVSGYNQFVNASVACNAPDEIKQRINAYLNGGMFYE